MGQVPLVCRDGAELLVSGSRDRQRPHMDGDRSTKMKAPKTACLSSLEWGRYRYMGAICSVSSEERRQKQKIQYVWLLF